MIFDSTPCKLGEGPLWHPLRQSLFWFDIQNCLMLERSLADDQPRRFQFEEYVSAAGWVDRDTLLIASETALFRFNLTAHDRENMIALEEHNPTTRSNDGRADPYGGFWIGTMGKASEPGAGAIYRYYRGALRKQNSNTT